MRLALQPLAEHRIVGNRLRQQFQRHDAVFDGVLGLVDLAHAAAADQPPQVVRAELGTRPRVPFGPAHRESPRITRTAASQLIHPNAAPPVTGKPGQGGESASSRAWISNVNSWSQMRMRSPSARVTLARIRSPRTSTPLADRKSVITKLVPVSMMTAWWRLTLASSRTMSLSGSRPIRVAAANSGYS